MAKKPLTDRSTVHLIIYSAAFVALCCLVSGVLLEMQGKTTSAVVLLSAPTTAITGFFALLARTGTNDRADGDDEPAAATPVTVTNTASDPVVTSAVEDTDKTIEMKASDYNQ